MAEIKADVLQIERLRLAAWMRLNGQRLLARHLEGDGRVIYLFERSQITDELMRQWEEKAPRTLLLSRFSSIVSFEIQKAVRMRRAAGLPTRLTSTEKS